MKRQITVGLGILLFVSACTTVNLNPSDSEPRQSAAADTTKQDGKEPFKEWAEAIKDTRAIEGLFTFHLKRDNTLYMELQAGQIGQDFGMVIHLSRGIPEFGLNDGLPTLTWDTQLMRFERSGDMVYLVHRNPRFTADASSPIRASLEENVGHSIVGAFKIQSIHKEKKSLLVDVTGFFVSDYANTATWLKMVYNNKPVVFDKEKSHIGTVQGFPKNVELDAELTFQASEPPNFEVTYVSDYRSIPVGIRYSLFALPETPMQPRYGDDRVGHFLTAVWDFSRDREHDPYLRYVNRWRLEKKDPAAEVSEPVQPIVFYIDRTVPKEYRMYVKEGIEAWNVAFEQAGFKNAIEVREAPENDSTWSAEDIRYSTVRWTTDPGAWAIGPSQVDPRTGEILNADILVSSGFTRYRVDEYADIVAPDGMNRWFNGSQELLQRLPREWAQRLCLAGMGRMHQLRFQHIMLAGLGIIEGGKPIPEAYLGDAIRDLVMHEVGHTLGLRHNFKASSGIPVDRLQDKEFTGRHGTSLSVMDYAPVNIALDPSLQGHHYNVRVGTYDVWAIEYAYTPIYEQTSDGPLARTGTLVTTPEAESVGLKKIAGLVAEPLHTYGTDEDNWLGAYAVDPLTNAWELGSDPLTFARDRTSLVARVQPVLEQRLIAEGEGYQRLRGAFLTLLSERYSSLLPTIKMVGGLYTARDHKLDKGERVPFTPVPAARQRETVALLVEKAFAEDAFRFDPALLNRLAPNRYSHWGTGYEVMPLDFPIHEYVSAVQGGLLELLLHPARLERMIDNGVRVPAGEEHYTPGELFQTLTAAIWSELGTGQTRVQTIHSFRRNLQRSYTDQLIRLLLNAPGWMRNESTGPVPIEPPEHARSLVRLELVELSQRIDQSIANAPDRDTRAHLIETKTRIDRALSADMVIQVK